MEYSEEKYDWIRFYTYLYFKQINKWNLKIILLTKVGQICNKILNLEGFCDLYYKILCQ